MSNPPSARRWRWNSSIFAFFAISRDASLITADDRPRSLVCMNVCSAMNIPMRPNSSGPIIFKYTGINARPIRAIYIWVAYALMVFFKVIPFRQVLSAGYVPLEILFFIKKIISMGRLCHADYGFVFLNGFWRDHFCMI